MTKWEYSCTIWSHKLHDDFAIEAAQVRLDAFSKEGWELIQIYKGIAYFKRPIEEEIPVYKDGVKLEKSRMYTLKESI